MINKGNFIGRQALNRQYPKVFKNIHVKSLRLSAILYICSKSMIIMLSRLGFLLFVPIFLLSNNTVHAQATDYLRHRKAFDLCSYHLECSDCHECGKQRYIVKIKNNVDKKIKSISYVFYSDVFNKVLTKEAKLKGDLLDNNTIGVFYICIPEPTHWAISKIVYVDGTEASFIVKDRLSNFIQEPDECDCND
jgi:hypothetical protein